MERDFTRPSVDGTEIKIMTRKTIAKYFHHLESRGLIYLGEDNEYYYLPVLEASEANLIEYNTLSKLLNVFQKNSISIYIYLFNRYYAAGKAPFIATMAQIKSFIGIATTTTSNNIIVDDTIEVLQRLGLLEYRLTPTADHKTVLTFLWVRNKLPE